MKHTNFSKFLSEASNTLTVKEAEDFILSILTGEKDSFIWTVYFVREEDEYGTHSGIESNPGDFFTYVKEVKESADFAQKAYSSKVDDEGRPYGDVMGIIQLGNIPIADHNVHLHLMYNPKKKKWSLTKDANIEIFL